jgi:hypothetical protein
MEAYSLDLRERICVAYDEGLDSVTELAERYGVGRCFIVPYYRLKPSPLGGTALAGIVWLCSVDVPA